MKCKNCEYFKPKFTGISVLFHLRHVRGWCTDMSNPTFNEFARTHYGRGLPWKEYLITRTFGCKYKRNCDTCIKHGNVSCPNSWFCYSTEDHPHWVGK